MNTQQQTKPCDWEVDEAWEALEIQLKCLQDALHPEESEWQSPARAYFRKLGVDEGTIFVELKLDVSHWKPIGKN